MPTPSRTYFTIQLPTSVKEWITVLSLCGGVSGSCMGSVYIAWSSLTGQMSTNGTRLAIVERTVLNMDRRLERVEDAVMDAHRPEKSAARTVALPQVKRAIAEVDP